MRTFTDGNGGGAAFLQSLRGQPGQPQCWIGELFTYTLPNGRAYRWTSYTQSLAVGGNVWLSAIDGAPLITRNRFGVKNTVEVPELEIRLGCTDTLLSNLKTQIHNGIWDGARAEMDRVFMPTPGDTSFGYVLLFNGRQSSAVIDAEGVTLTAKGDNVLMNQQTPRNLYQTNCLHTFCDSGCALNAADYTFTGVTVAYGSGTRQIIYTLPDGFTGAQFTQGVVTMTSGAAIGQVRTIRFANDTTLLPTYPFYDAPVPGDTFNLLLGCDRQQTSCQNRYPAAGGGPISNIQHFRGYPYTPQAYIAV